MSEQSQHFGKCFLRAIMAGMSIGLGGAVLLGTMSINPELKWVGAILFSIGLFGVFTFGFDLYTGKVGYMFDNKPWTYGIDLLIMLVGNFIGALFIGLLMPMSDQFVPGFIDGRLNMLDDPIMIIAKGIFCGILMFIAADVYKTKKSYLGAFICVPVFILAGSEHSIADMFYFCSAGVFTLDALCFILLVALGNAIGGVIIPVFQKFMYEEQK
ncbi:MAG: formate/nitrite transporter family protein [Candidatus Methanomethylophilaceae archaeon]|nr:formate/nitrite transporter family protein [Candidatus Methanomethylophilaceae archaeon]